MGRVVCQFCQDVLQDGPAMGTKFVTCTKCMVRRNPGSKTGQGDVLDSQGKKIISDKEKAKGMTDQYAKDAKTMLQLDELEKALGIHVTDPTLDVEFFMVEGKVTISFQIKMPFFEHEAFKNFPSIQRLKKFDFGFGVEQMEDLLKQMKEIQEKQSKKKELRDNLEKNVS